MRRALSLILPVLRRAGFDRLVERIISRLPPGVQLRWKKLKVSLGYGGSLQLVPLTELQASYHRALALLVELRGADEVGDYLEFGVGAGTSMTAMYRAASGFDPPLRPRLIGFDSFQGLPAGAEEESGSTWHPGQYRSDRELVEMNLARHRVPLDKVTLVAGWYQQTLTDETVARLQLTEAGVILVDCDLYSSATAALAFCAPLIRTSTIIFFDEWVVSEAPQEFRGERQAFQEFLAGHPEFSAQELEEIGTYKAPSRAFLVSRVEASRARGNRAS